MTFVFCDSKHFGSGLRFDLPPTPLWISLISDSMSCSLGWSVVWCGWWGEKIPQITEHVTEYCVQGLSICFVFPFSLYTVLLTQS